MEVARAMEDTSEYEYGGGRGETDGSDSVASGSGERDGVGGEGEGNFACVGPRLTKACVAVPIGLGKELLSNLTCPPPR